MDRMKSESKTEAANISYALRSQDQALDTEPNTNTHINIPQLLNRSIYLLKSHSRSAQRAKTKRLWET